MMGARNNNLHSLATDKLASERLMQMQRNQIFLLHPIPPIARPVKISVDKLGVLFLFGNTCEGRCGWSKMGNV